MAWNEVITSGMRGAAKPGAGGNVPRSFPVFGIVKDNMDPLRIGRLQVYLVDNSADNSDDNNSWVTVSYMSPFYGLTQNTAPNTGYGSYEGNSNSYGMWTSPPDIGTTVICIFINGDPNFGFWIGAVPEPEALHMVPAIGAADNVVTNSTEASSYGGATRLPVVNINSNNKEISDTSKFLTEAKPVHSYQAALLNNQGLLRDPIRGTIGSNAQREAPSRVTGISTPGRPIYEGGFTDQTIAKAISNPNLQSPTKIVARRGGHSLVMDDGDIIGRDQLIRLRTAMGHQILMSDDGQTLFIIHSNGLSWVELGKEGTIDMYATNSVNVRTQGDLNLHADRDVNINAGRNLNIKSEQQTKINAEAEMEIRTSSAFQMYSAGNYTLKCDASMSYLSSGDAGFKSDAIVYVEGSRINLNSGSASLVPQEPKLIPIIAHTDTLWDDAKGFIAAPAKLLSIVNRAPAHSPWSSAGTGVDVNINLKASSAMPSEPSPAVIAASSEAPSTPENPVTGAIAATVPTPTAVSQSLDKNTTGAMLGAISTAAATGQTASAIQNGAGIVTGGNGLKTAAVGAFAATPDILQNAAVLKPGSAPLVNSLIQNGKSLTSAMPASVFTGAGGMTNLKSVTNNVTAQSGMMVGVLQQSQTALTSAGIMTGREAPNAVTGIIMAGATAGVRSTVSYVQSAINSSISKTLNKSVAGVKGNPIAAAVARGVAGAVSGAASQVVNATARAVTTSVIGSIQNSIGSVPQAISAGRFAGTLATTSTGAMGSVAGALKGMSPTAAYGGATPTPYDDDGNLNPGWKINEETGDPYVDVLSNSPVKSLSRGVPASAFSAISQSLPSLKPGVPQNLRQISAQATAAAQGTDLGSVLSNTVTKAAANAVNSAVKGAATAVGSAVTSAATGAINSALRNAVSGTSGIGGAIARSVAGATAGAINSTIRSGVQSAVNASVSAILPPPNSTSGLNLIPGGQNAVSAVVNSSLPFNAAVPGTEIITGAINNVAKAAVGAAVNSTTNAVTGALNASIRDLSTSLTKSIGGGIIGGAVSAGITGALRGATAGAIQEFKKNTNSIVTSVLSGLPTAAQSQVNSKLSSLNSGGKASVSLPQVATGTSDIGSINNKFSSLTGKRVPAPLYGGNPATVGPDGNSEIWNKVVEWSKEISSVRDQFAVAELAALEAENIYNDAKNSRPPGDPEIESLRQTYYTARLKANELSSRLKDLESSPPG